MKSIFVYSIGVKPICLFCLTGVLGLKWLKSVLARIHLAWPTPKFPSPVTAHHELDFMHVLNQRPQLPTHYLSFTKRHIMLDLSLALG